MIDASDWEAVTSGAIARIGDPAARSRARHALDVDDFLRRFLVTASRASASERSQRTFITIKVRSSYCSESRIQSFISSESRALISLAGR
jgi:hypothetical protein